MGMVTGIGGGMPRDLLAGRVPVVFRGELYATPALAGAVVAVVRHALRPAGLASSRSAGGGALPRSGGCSRCWRALAGRRCPTPASAQRADARRRLGVSRRGPGAGRGWRRPGRGRAGRAGRGTPPKRGYAGARSAAVRVCTLPQCGRPSWARRIGSIARSTPCGRRRGGCGRRGRTSPGRYAVDSGMSSAGRDPDLDREADPQVGGVDRRPGPRERGRARPRAGRRTPSPGRPPAAATVKTWCGTSV